jgi:predicted CXXCH cytochrome family protein
LERKGIVAKYPIAYSIGAGMVGYSYMVRIDNYLFQSPASYYSQNRNWDLTPGYETDQQLDFTHQISTGCLFCHTGSVNLIRGATNEFGDPPFTAISCERCHGAPDAHLKNPAPGSIVNPAKLAPARRDSICEQCHLEGEMRVLNPGDNWWSFEAGEPTERVFVTYLKTASSGTLRAVSQSELLAQSRCANQSGGRLWCGTCHNPHSEDLSRAQTIKGVCLACHSDLFATRRHQAASECISCHMPRLQPTDVAHSAITDHSIPRLPRSRPPDSAETGSALRAWREPDHSLVQRDLALAYFDLASSSHSSTDVQQAYRLLSQLPARYRSDPDVEADLGSILLAAGQEHVAIEEFERAVEQNPSNARFAYCLGVALERTGRTAAGIKELRRSIQLDPSQPDAYMELAQFYRRAGLEGEARTVLREYLHFMPQSIRVRLTD